MTKEIAKILVSILLSVCLAALVLSRPAPERPVAGSFERIMAGSTLRCGYVSYPPYFEMDIATRQPRGIFADLMAEIGSRMNVKIVWAGESSWATLTEDIRSGRFDAICSGVWQNSSRGLAAGFSLPVGYVPVGAWVRAGDNRFRTSLDLMNGPDVRVSVMDGETGELLRRQRFPDTQAVSLPQTSPFSDLMINVATGKADVVFAENRIVADYLKQNPGTLEMAADDNVLTAYPLVILLPGNDPQFKTAVDSALSEILYSGKMADILRKNGAGDALFLPARPW
jgi:ABC-type amino acid transport substrate-binding protein